MMPNESMVSVVGMFVISWPVSEPGDDDGAVGKKPSKFCPAVVGVRPAAAILLKAC